MNYKSYIEEKKELYDDVLKFIDDNTNNDEYFEKLTCTFHKQHITDNKQELHLLCCLLSKLSENHFRYENFFKNLFQILQYLSNQIKQTMTNFEIFNIFKNNNKVLLFLLQNKIITLDEQIINQMINIEFQKYRFLLPELKPYQNEAKQKEIEDELKNENPTIFDDFDKKRETGENDSYICSLIRKDSIEEFISHLNRMNISFTNLINQSIFETNQFLIDKKPSFIEYAAFFGSIQIFKYLFVNEVQLKPSLWLYAIHGANAEIIKILEDNEISPKDKSYDQCFREAVKCHHNEIADYIQINFLNYEIEQEDESEDEKNPRKEFYRNPISYGFNYYNFNFIPKDSNQKFILQYICQYGYFDLLKIYLETPGIDLNEGNEILNHFLFNNQILSIFFLSYSIGMCIKRN